MSRCMRSARRLGAIAVALGTLSFSGCTAARDTLGTNSSPCFRALALAADAVHDRGVFTGVRLVSASSLAKLHRPDFQRVEQLLSQRSRTRLHNLCLVSYRGTFHPDQVKQPAEPVPLSGVGHFAVVVVSTPQNEVLATFVLEKEPVRMRHLALGHPHGGPAPVEGSGLG
jgi:hypothetical protein